MSGRAKVHVFDSGERVFGRGAPGPPPALDGVRGIVSGGGLTVLMVTIFILRVRYEELDSAMVLPASVCRVQAVTARSRALRPRVAAPEVGPAALLRAAEHHPVGGAGWGLTGWLLPSYDPFLQVVSVLWAKQTKTRFSQQTWLV